MLERYFVKPSTVDRIRASWLAPEIERYVEWMDSQGYAIRNVFHRVPMLCRFAEFAKQHGCIDLRSDRGIRVPVASYPRSKRQDGRSRSQDRRRGTEPGAADAETGP